MTESVAETILRLESMVAGGRDPRGRAFAPIGELLRCEGRLEEARERVEAGLHADPDFSSGHMVAARIYADLGRDGSARASAERVLALDDGNEEAQALLAALERAQEEEALHWARAQGDAPAVAVDDGEVLTVTMGDLYLSQGAPDRAVALFQRLLAVDPDNPTIRERLASARAELGVDTVDVDELAPDTAEIVTVADLAPEVVPVSELAPEIEIVPVGHLGPEAADIASLAPDALDVQLLAPDAESATDDDSDRGDEERDPFLSWLDDQ